MNNLIQIKNISKSYGENKKNVVLNKINYKFKKGLIYSLMGPSGSGKSTLIRHINRLIDPTDGEIIVDGTHVMQLNEKELIEFRKHKMSMVFQRLCLFPHKTVIQNLAYGL